MALIKNVEKFTLTLAADTAFADGTLTLGQDTDYCVPFFTTRLTTGNSDTTSGYAVKMSFPTTSSVRAETATSATRALVVEVTVVQFEPTEANVYSDAFAMADTETSDTPTAFTSVVAANSFIYHSWTTGASNSNSACTVSGRFTAGTNPTTAVFERGTGTAAIDGNYWVVEAINSGFTTEYLTIDTAGGTTGNTGTISTVATDRTMLISSHWLDVNVGADDNESYVATFLASSTSVGTVRAVPEANWDITTHIFVVQFASGGTTVQRPASPFYTTQATATSLDDVTLQSTIGTLADAMAHSTGGLSWLTGAHDSTSSSVQPDAWVAMTLPDADTIRLQHLTAGAQAKDYYIGWEVVEWDTGGAAPAARRIMVIS